MTLPCTNLISFIYFASFSSRILPLRTLCLPIQTYPQLAIGVPNRAASRGVMNHSTHAAAGHWPPRRVGLMPVGALVPPPGSPDIVVVLDLLPLSGGGQEHASREHHSRGMSPEPRASSPKSKISTAPSPTLARDLSPGGSYFRPSESSDQDDDRSSRA